MSKTYSLKSKFALWTTVILTSLLVENCSLTVEPLKNDQLKWFTPYSKSDAAIFISDKNERDTIIFRKMKVEKDTTTNFIELGYYSTNYFSVPYEFTPGSYHQSALMGDGQKRYDHSLFNLSVTSDNRTEFEIEFIGTIFYGKYLDNIIKLSSTAYYFDSSKATYQGMNTDKSINDFTFDTKKGIVKFTDERNVKWLRQN